MKGQFLKSFLAKVSLLVAETDTSDRELLQRFRQQNDEASFQMLLRKYGPMVWNVCRQMLPRDADAEDAFQATFLALAQQSGTIREHERLGGWLHGVAFRVAMKIRRSAATRRQREQRVSRPESQENQEPIADEILAAVHEEVHRLPSSERTAFILCYFEGLRQEEAARQLGCKLGTLSGRLCRARQRILERLTQRGIAPSLTAATVGLSAATSTARAPIDLCVKTVFICTTKTEAIAPLILELAKGASMIGLRTKMLAAAVMVSGTLAIGIGGTLMGQQETRTLEPASANDIPAIAEKPRNPPAATSPEAGMQAITNAGWEYKIVNQDINAINEDAFNQLGQDGWEFCTTLSGNPGRILFKRQRGNTAVALVNPAMTGEVPYSGPVTYRNAMPAGGTPVAPDLTPVPAELTEANKPTSRPISENELVQVYIRPQGTIPESAKDILLRFVDCKIDIDKSKNMIQVIGTKSQIDKILQLMTWLEKEPPQVVANSNRAPTLTSDKDYSKIYVALRNTTPDFVQRILRQSYDCHVDIDKEKNVLEVTGNQAHVEYLLGLINKIDVSRSDR